MQNQEMPTNPELLAADAALRRAAINAKKLAEQLGTPYVVYKLTNEEAAQNTKEDIVKS